MNLASRIDRIEASRTLQVKEKALELKARGVDVIDLTAGEPDFPTPDYVAQAGIRAIEEGFTKYTANTGIPELREAIAQKLASENGLIYSADQIVVSNGAKQSLLNALMALVEKGDEVLVPLPYWVSYPEQIKIAGAQPVFLDTTTTHFKITPEKLEEKISSRTKAIIINSPCNPTGVVYSAEELLELANFLKDRDIWIISDEIYEKIIFDGRIHTSIATFHDFIDRSVVVNGFSKSHSMTGWRIGYAAAPPRVVKAMAKIQSHYTSNASSISQKAALAALTGPPEKLAEMKQTFQKRRDFIQSLLDTRSYFSYVYPRGAFYFFIKVSEVYGCRCGDEVITNSMSFSTYLTEKYHLVTVPGIAFGADEYIRISFAAGMSQLDAGMNRLIKGMDEMMELKRG